MGIDNETDRLAFWSDQILFTIGVSDVDESVRKDLHRVIRIMCQISGSGLAIDGPLTDEE